MTLPKRTNAPPPISSSARAVTPLRNAAAGRDAGALPTGVPVLRRPPQGTWAVCDCGNHAFAPVGHGLNVLVSPEDAHVLRYKWHVARDHTGYLTVRRSMSVGGGKYFSAILCRIILDAPKGALVDHKSGNTLDNRRTNIRICSHSENTTNSDRARGTNPYRGVQRSRKKFAAVITKHGVRRILGYFTSAEEARAAYECAALELHGEFTRVG